MNKIVLVMIVILAGCSTAKVQPMSNASSVPVAATPVPAPVDPTLVSCEKGNDSRTLAIVITGKSCVLNYSKGGKTHAAYSSSSSKKRCEAKQFKMRRNLEKSGYQCK